MNGKMPWIPPELRRLPVRRVKINEERLTEDYSALVGQTFSGTYMGTYQVPESNRMDSRRVHRGTIRVSDEKMEKLLKELRDTVESSTFWSGVTCAIEKDVSWWLWCLEPIERVNVGQKNHFYVSGVTFFKESEFRAEAEIQVEVVA